MIELVQLTKKYGDTVALDHVTLNIQPGDVVGLLGPNGAGKTTMLKMLTGYLPPTEGTARVAQLDILDDSLKVRQRVGYLPETNPLYEDLAVYESLLWTARLRHMNPGEIASAIRQVIGTCGLESVVGKNIGELSKGYRQRLGLAQAIVHDPEILILDEPTSGLDPNQQQEVRQLILALKQKKTVLLSTHILSEAQSTCDRVVIIHQGKIVADGTPQALGQQLTGGSKLVLELKASPEQAQSVLATFPGVSRVTPQRSTEKGAVFLLECLPETDVREAIFQMAVENRWPILQLTRETVSLEDVFRQLTVRSGS